MKYGLWTVLERRIAKNLRAEIFSRCECGTEKWINEYSAKCGDSRSCGCLKNMELGNRRRTHGARHTKIYTIWICMRDRCENQNAAAWPRYGGRGITVCDRWSSFEAFRADMGDPPSGLTLDRKDNDGTLFSR